MKTQFFEQERYLCRYIKLDIGCWSATNTASLDMRLYNLRGKSILETKLRTVYKGIMFLNVAVLHESRINCKVCDVSLHLRYFLSELRKIFQNTDFPLANRSYYHTFG